MGAASESHPEPGNSKGWRRLGAFWLAVFAITVAGAGVLEWLGPPPSAQEADSKPSGAASKAVSQVSDVHGVVLLTPRPVPVPPIMAGRDTPGPVADPDPGLLEPGGGSKD